MNHLLAFRPKPGRFLTSLFISIATLIIPLIGTTPCIAQSKPSLAPEMQWSNDLNSYPGLLPEFAHLFDKMQHEVQFPPPRSQTRLLPLLPESTVFYAAFPNYGDALDQALKIFSQELQASPVLRDWWQHVNSDGTAKPQELLQKFYELSQYLGDEIVISGTTKGKEPSVLCLAEIRKPGLKAFLERMLAETFTSSKPTLRVLDPEQLAIEKDVPDSPPVILVRPDFVIAASDVAALRGINAKLSLKGATTLAATSFGNRLAQAYEGGVTTLGGADLHTILKLIPWNSKEQEQFLERTGFADMKYAVWEHKTIGGRDVSEAELSFNGPRQRIAAWLAAPRELGSLDFVSPETTFAISLALTSPAQIFDDVQEMDSATASPSRPNPLMMGTMMMQALGLNIKDDLLSLLTGEITADVGSPVPPSPAWKLILGVKDEKHLQQTLNTLLSASHVQPERSEEDGTIYYTIQPPSQARPVEISYTLVDGYLVLGSSLQVVRRAVRLHRSRGSLEQSQTFRDSLPPGQPLGLSALLYEDPAAMTALWLNQATPELRESLAPMFQQKSPLIVRAYGDEAAIREATTSAGFDPAAVMVVAAIAIPNLLRARTAANDSSAGAVGMLRTVDTAEVTYSTMYPQRGFAPNLAALGPDPAAPGSATPSHASLIDATLGNPGCTSNTWCVKSGFRFRVSGEECRQGPCQEFVAVASPVSSSTGSRNFCSTSDGVIRFQLGQPLTSPVTASECRAWQPIQ